MCIFPYLSIYVPILAIPSVKSSFGAPPVISNVCPNFLDDVSLRVGSSGLSVLKYIGFSTLSSLVFVAVSNLTVTFVPEADVSIPSSPNILNLRPLSCDNFCSSVVVELFPPNFILLSPILSNWLLLTASVGSVPGPTFVILFPSALIPLLSITVFFPPVPGIVIFLVVTESKSFRSLFKLYVYLWFQLFPAT